LKPVHGEMTSRKENITNLLCPNEVAHHQWPCIRFSDGLFILPIPSDTARDAIVNLLQRLSTMKNIILLYFGFPHD
jgi:hypothetical protein